MTKNEVLSSAMAEDQIAKLEARKEEIAESVEQRKAEFEESDVEKRDSILDEVEEMTNEAKDIDSEIAEMEEVRDQFKEQEKRMSIMENVKTEVVESRSVAVDKYDTPEYREAWVNYIKTGDDKELRTAGLSTATTNVPVPTIFQGYVETAWYNYGKFSRLVNKSYTAGYLSIPFESAADGASVHTELADAPAEEEITLGLIELKPAMIKKWIDCVAFA